MLAIRHWKQCRRKPWGTIWAIVVFGLGPFKTGKVSVYQFLQLSFSPFTYMKFVLLSPGQLMHPM